MLEEKYQEFLATAPEDHFSNEFRTFLIQNNKVRKALGHWLVIENIKYRTNENDWLTAFYIGPHIKDEKHAIFSTDELWAEYYDREWLIKHPKKRTVKLFHIHLYHKSP